MLWSMLNPVNSCGVTRFAHYKVSALAACLPAFMLNTVAYIECRQL